MKKVLILTYYWPPSGGAGVQRWLKFVKYLRDFGWEPIVYTAQDAEYPVLDFSLEKDVPEGLEVLRLPIREPHGLYKKMMGKKKEERVFNVFVEDGKSGTLKQKLALYIRANFFIPDSRFMWIKPSARYLETYLRSNDIDVVVSTGPPHSVHLIALHLKRKLKLPWLADFRDPWTTIDYTDDMPYSGFTLRKTQKMESDVLKTADQIVVVGEFMQREFETKTTHPIHVITNGYDSDDFRIGEMAKDPKTFRLVHTGSLNKRRNHPALWRAISEFRQGLSTNDRRIGIRLIGNTDHGVHEELQRLDLMDCTEFIDYLPHDQIVVEQLMADVLLLPINRFGEDALDFKSAKSTLTGKLFEYLAAANPILAIGIRDSQLEKVLSETRMGRLCEFDDVAAMKYFLQMAYRNELPAGDKTAIGRYDRKNLTERLVNVLNRMSG